MTSTPNSPYEPPSQEPIMDTPWCRPHYSLRYMPQAPGRYAASGNRLGPLPDTPFYELDRVTLTGQLGENFRTNSALEASLQDKFNKACPRSPRTLPLTQQQFHRDIGQAVIVSINYQALIEEGDSRIYRISPAQGASWQMSVSARDIARVVKRGPVWEYLKNRAPPFFDDVHEAIDFYLAVGQGYTWPKPADVSHWTIEHLKALLESEKIHAWSNIYHSTSQEGALCPVIFHDNTLGTTLRKELLQAYSTPLERLGRKKGSKNSNPLEKNRLSSPITPRRLGENQRVFVKAA